MRRFAPFFGDDDTIDLLARLVDLRTPDGRVFLTPSNVRSIVNVPGE